MANTWREACSSARKVHSWLASSHLLHAHWWPEVVPPVLGLGEVDAACSMFTLKVAPSAPARFPPPPPFVVRPRLSQHDGRGLVLRPPHSGHRALAGRGPLCRCRLPGIPPGLTPALPVGRGTASLHFLWLPQHITENWWLKMTEIHSLPVLEAGSLKLGLFPGILGAPCLAVAKLQSLLPLCMSQISLSFLLGGLSSLGVGSTLHLGRSHLKVANLIMSIKNLPPNKVALTGTGVPKSLLFLIPYIIEVLGGKIHTEEEPPRGGNKQGQRGPHLGPTSPAEPPGR